VGDRGGAGGRGGDRFEVACPNPQFGNPQSAIELCVIDTGKGMSPDVVARAFKPFFSTRPGGTGLGLATTRKIIEAHGGRIELESAEGRGTKFAIHLPAIV